MTIKSGEHDKEIEAKKTQSTLENNTSTSWRCLMTVQKIPKQKSKEIHGSDGNWVDERKKFAGKWVLHKIHMEGTDPRRELKDLVGKRIK